MRRLSLICAALLCASLLSANGQTSSSKYVPDYRWEVRAGWGIVPFVNGILYGIASLSHINDEAEDKQQDDGIATGDLSIDISRKLNRWLAVGVDLGYQGFTSSLGGEMASHSLDVVAIMPNVTMNYLTREKWTLYGKVEAGAALYKFDCSDPQLQFVFQASPIGVTFGHKFYGFAELSAGMLYQGGKLGVGYRF